MLDEALVVGRRAPDARTTLSLLEPNSAPEPRVMSSLDSCVPRMDNATTPRLEETDPMISLPDDTRNQVDNGYDLGMPSQAQDDCAAAQRKHLSCQDDLDGEQLVASNDDSDEDTLYHTKYELRPQTRTHEDGVMSTWIDKDETGDYDPVEESRRLNKRAPKRKQRTKPQVPPPCDGDCEDPNQDSVTVPDTPRLMVQLKFADKQKVRKRLEEIARLTDPENEHDFGSRRLRRREGRTTLGDHDKSTCADRKDQHARLEHFEGHPAARGCRHCLSNKISCSLLDDAGGWPCITCTNEHTECELIIAPTYKAPCEQCKRRNVICSYTVTLDHSGPCVNCAAYKESRCVAGPLKHLFRPRINYNGDIRPATIAAFCDHGLDAAALPRQKAFTPELIYTCKRCDEAGRRCSFMVGTEEDECTSCQMGGQICLKKLFTGHTKKPAQIILVNNQPALEQRPEGATKRRAPVSAHTTPPAKIRKLTPASSSAPEHRITQITTKPTPNISPAPERRTKQIRTELSHPISFNYDATDPSITKRQPCHFCSSIHFAYPLLGIGQSRVIDVYDDPNQAGLIEHKPSRYERTRMCIACTTYRLDIIRCTSHCLHPIPGIEFVTLDFKAAFSKVFSSTHQEDTTHRDRWCSLCLNLAVHECVKPVGAAGQQTKCGLALCKTCVAEFESACPEGNLEAMLAGLCEGRSAKRPLGLRADWAMLKQDGLLVRFIMWKMSNQEGENLKAEH